MTSSILISKNSSSEKVKLGIELKKTRPYRNRLHQKSIALGDCTTSIISRTIQHINDCSLH